MTATQETVNPNLASEVFAEKLISMMNDGATVVMLSLGYKLGIFDVMADLPPSSSRVIAERCDLHERYIREWLAVMTTAGIVYYEPGTRLYLLPPAHAACLTRASAPDNMAVTAQFIPLIAKMEEALAACFRSGDGLPYHAYPCFHQVMSEDSGQTVVAALFDHVLPLVPELESRLEAGIEVLDAGCGGGRAILAMAEAYPKSRFTGYDLCAEAFAGTAREALTKGLTNLRFEARDLRDFHEPWRYDLITSFDAVHDQPAPQNLLTSIARALKPGGVYLMQDIGGSSYLEKNLNHPVGPLLYSISCAHCTPVSLGQGGPGLGTMWGEELAEAMLRDAGFREIRSHRLDHDPVNVYFVAQTGR